MRDIVLLMRLALPGETGPTSAIESNCVMNEGSLPTAVAARIDSLCQQFEAALADGRQPNPEEYVARAESADREALRAELDRMLDQFEQATTSRINGASLRASPVDGHDSTPNAEPADPYLTVPSNPPGTMSGDAASAFGRYQVKGLLGEGGFGTVYLGYDPLVGREVAIKVPRRSRDVSYSQAEAYLNEARMVGRLDHPQIVPVYDVGRSEDGLCYVVSKLITGGSLADLVRQKCPDACLAAEIVAQVAEALHHAHQHGLVHRDIKPANILIDESGRPLVADFGLALADEDFGHGASLCGTVPYMSPEQAAGGSDRLDARSDIYSLGVVLYELLTGRRPHRSTKLPEVLDEISNSDVRPPRQLDHTIPQELERICLKALAKRPADRYTTAYDLADDLRRFLSSSESPPVPSYAAAPKRRALPSTLLTVCGAILLGFAAAAIVFVPAKSPPRFSELTLSVAPVRDGRASDELTEEYTLIDAGAAVGLIADERFASNEAFSLAGHFVTPCHWQLLWFDTRGEWSLPDAPSDAERDFAYPLSKKKITVARDDPPGTHLLLVVASQHPISQDKLRAALADVAKPPEVGLRSWAPVAGSRRGPGQQVDTVDSYLQTIAAALPGDCQAVAALFLPTDP